MKKSLVSLAFLAAISTAAFANGQGGLGHPGVGGGGGGGGGGTGVGVGVGLASSAANAAVSSQIGIANTVGLDVRNTAAGGAGGLGLGGNGFGGTGTGGTATGGQATIGAGAVTVDASTSYKAAAAPSYAPMAHGPVKSCRLFMGFGGAVTSGSLSGGIPIGNDQFCVVENAHEMMNRMNAMAPATFSRDDYLRPVCKAEGMSDTAACKALEGREKPAGTSVNYGPN